MNVTTDMYTKLFNELTDIMNDLENIKERIKKVQLETEEIYINKVSNTMYNKMNFDNVKSQEDLNKIINNLSKNQAYTTLSEDLNSIVESYILANQNNTHTTA